MRTGESTDPAREMGYLSAHCELDVNEDGQKGWLADLLDAYGGARLWIIGVLGPWLAISEFLQGRAVLGVGLAFVCVLIWTQLAKRHGAEGASLDRIANVSLTIGGTLMAWHYVRWWVEYLL